MRREGERPRGIVIFTQGHLGARRWAPAAGRMLSSTGIGGSSLLASHT